MAEISIPEALKQIARMRNFLNVFDHLEEVLRKGSAVEGAVHAREKLIPQLDADIEDRKQALKKLDADIETVKSHFSTQRKQLNLDFQNQTKRINDRVKALEEKATEREAELKASHEELVKTLEAETGAIKAELASQKDNLLKVQRRFDALRKKLA